MDYNKEADWFSVAGSTNSSVSTWDTASKTHVRSPEPEINLKLQLLKESFSETIAENIVLGKEILNLLHKLNIDLKSLPKDIRDGLQNVSLILKSERLSDLDESALLICRERKYVEEKRKCRQEMKLKMKYEAVLKKHISVQKKLNQIQDAVSSIESMLEKAKADNENEYPNQVLLSTKINNYKQTVNNLEVELNNMQVTELEPDKIISKFRTYMEMMGHLSELNQVLDQYGDLPPNLLQAKAIVENKEKEYEKISQMFLQQSI